MESLLQKGLADAKADSAVKLLGLPSPTPLKAALSRGGGVPPGSLEASALPLLINSVG